MEGQFFLTTIAGLGVSIAGFAGLAVALRPNHVWTAIDRWRVRNVINLGFATSLLALLPIPIFTITADLALTVRIASGTILLGVLIQVFRVSRGDAAEWPDGRSAYYLTQTLLAVVPTLVNLWLANVGLLQLILLMHLFHPANIFINVLGDVVRAHRSESEPTP